VRQLQHSYSVNRKFNKPCQILITSLAPGTRVQQRFEQIRGHLWKVSLAQRSTCCCSKNYALVPEFDNWTNFHWKNLVSQLSPVIVIFFIFIYLFICCWLFKSSFSFYFVLSGPFARETFFWDFATRENCVSHGRFSKLINWAWSIRRICYWGICWSQSIQGKKNTSWNRIFRIERAEHLFHQSLFCDFGFWV
jgi:hypothetical protein